jgi:succinate dehydrogenase cytochrome b556 subunit
MAALASTASKFLEGLLYQGREGHLSYRGHRLAGLGTLLFLAIHILDTSTVYFFPSLYSHAIDLYRSPVFMLGEILLVAAVIFHGVNGLKIILNDTFPQWWNKHDERRSFWRVVVLTFVLWVFPAYLMGKALYENSICRCPTEGAVDVVARTNAALVTIPIAFVIVLGVLAFGAPHQNTGPASSRTFARPKTLEAYAWLFMRWSGGLLIPLAWGHVLIQDVLIGVYAINIDYVAMRWATLGWRVYDIALLGFAFAHGMNGLRGIAEDYVHHPGWLKAVKFVIFWGWVIITAIGAVAIIGGVRGL